MVKTTLTGHLVTGLGEAATFTRIDWARDQFVTKLGIDPFPGTVNLTLDDAVEIAKWARIRALPGIALISPRTAWCNARCYPVRIGKDIPGAIVFPEVADYPAAKVEVIAAVGVRAALGVVDGDPVTLEIGESSGTAQEA